MIEITVDSRDVLRDLRVIRTDQIPFALKESINAVGKLGQIAQRQHQRDIFTARQPQWLDRSVKITHFATKAEPHLTIGVHPPGAQGEQRADILTKFETERTKVPFSGTHVAIPTGVKRNRRDIVKDELRPKALRLRRVGGRVLGEHRTFLVDVGQPWALILQRIGRGRGSTTRSLYLLVPSVEIEPELQFHETIARVVDREWNLQFAAAWAKALRTAR